MIHLRTVLTIVAVGSALAGVRGHAQEPAEALPGGRIVKLPGLVADLENRHVDLDATVCLDNGMLELIACTRDTKEHESIVAVEARPMHIHTALLLVGLRNGNPAMSRRVDGDPPRWVAVPPRGDAVEVSLVVTGVDGQPVELPIRHFVARADAGDVPPVPGDPEADAEAAFPDAFVFAGSQVHTDPQGKRQYLADASGHVISIATFGDEVLCTPAVSSADNESLVWAVNPEMLPKVGTHVILRLRPKQAE